MSDVKMRDLSPLAVRMPPAIRARVVELAKENHRSINAEIVFRLERAIFDKFEMQKPAAQS